jgi:hypothetical protein
MNLSTVNYPDVEKDFVHIDSKRIVEILTVAKKQGLENICLNPSFGWVVGSSLDFLKDNIWIKGVSIICEHCNITPINYLKNLNFYSGAGQSYSGQLDFTNFSHLEYLSFNWNEKTYKNFQSLSKLNEASIWRFTNTDLQIFKNLSFLKILNLNFANKLDNLRGVERMKYLKRLSIYSAPKLIDISALSATSETLLNLSFWLCRGIQDYKTIEELINLETFVIQKSAPIHTIEMLKQLNKLWYVSIETEILDGNVAYLKEKKFKYKKMKKYDKN